MKEDVLIEVEGLSKKFCKDLKTSLWYGLKDVTTNAFGGKAKASLRPKEFWSLKDVNFQLKRGECLGLIGHNGAGKSTLLKILNGLIKPDEGTVTIRGKVGALIELGAGFNPILTGRENIYNNGAVLGFSKAEIDAKLEAIIDFAEIREFIDMPVQNYSSGMKVRLGFAVASQMEPDVLIIDEVLAVGDVAFRMKCYKRILELIERKTAVIFVSHNIGQVLRVCDLGMTMDNGLVKYYGDVSNAIANYEELYLTKKVERLEDKKSNYNENAYIESINLLNEDRDIISDFNTGDDVICQIKLKSGFKIEKTRLRICIESINLGPLGAFSSPFSDIFIDISPNEEKVIEVLIENIPLQLGSYNIIVGWYGEGENAVLDVKNFGASLNIVGPKIQMLAYGVDGLILFKHKWLRF